MIRIRLGDVIPADAKLIEGEYLSVDQAALTGESLPVNKKVGDVIYSGSIAKQGEMIAVITATGVNTFFGKTAKLVAGAGNVSHFQQAVMRIGNFLIIISVALCRITSYNVCYTKLLRFCKPEVGRDFRALKLKFISLAHFMMISAFSFRNNFV